MSQESINPTDSNSDSSPPEPPSSPQEATPDSSAWDDPWGDEPSSAPARKSERSPSPPRIPKPKPQTPPAPKRTPSRLPVSESESWWAQSTEAAAQFVLEQWQALKPRLQRIEWRSLLTPTTLQRTWATLLRGVRARLPQTWNAKLSDSLLSGVLLGSMAIALIMVVSLGSGQPSSPSVATAPSPSSPSSAPTQSISPRETSQSASPFNQDLATQIGLPRPVADRAPLKLPPQQQLIADIQDQLATISNQDAAGVIQSSQANFRTSTLTVTVSQDWFGLSASRQDRLANELLMRSRDLSFNKLELIDDQGHRLGRSPVVGDVMVIFQRTPPAA